MGDIGLPKALIEIEGRTLLERSIESLKDDRSFESRCRSRPPWRQDRTSFFLLTNFGIEVSTVHQEQPLGLAHAIATAADKIDSDFVVLCPDNLYTDETDLSRAREKF